MTYELILTGKFKKSLKRAKKRGLASYLSKRGKCDDFDSCRYRIARGSA